jgi:hypothetical protein
MNTNIKTSESPVLAVGRIDDDAFQAEFFPSINVVVCYDPSLDDFLSKGITQQADKSLAIRLLTKHWLFIPLKHWLFVEVQTRLGKIHVRKVAGLRIRNGGRSAHYEDLSLLETRLLKSRLERFQIHLNGSKKPGKPSPNNLHSFSSCNEGNTQNTHG